MLALPAAMARGCRGHAGGCYNQRDWACSTAVSAGDSSTRCLRAETREVDGMNSGKPAERSFHGNPEPSRRYTGGRCRDYLRARAPLMTGWSIPHPHARRACAGEEIVHSRWKRRGEVNPLVVGSNPTGPNSTGSPAFAEVRRTSKIPCFIALYCSPRYGLVRPQPDLFWSNSGGN